jgi:hypothetical protein
MHSANAYSIRPATAADAYVLRKLAELDSQSPVSRPALIGEIDGRPAAALSLADGRVVADPFQHTAQIKGLLTMRFRAMRAFERSTFSPKRKPAFARLAA